MARLLRAKSQTSKAANTLAGIGVSFRERFAQHGDAQRSQVGYSSFTFKRLNLRKTCRLSGVTISWRLATSFNRRISRAYSCLRMVRYRARSASEAAFPSMCRAKLTLPKGSRISSESLVSRFFGFLQLFLQGLGAFRLIVIRLHQDVMAL